jgi:putative flippase GtrA
MLKDILKKETVIQFMKFVFVGGTAFLIDFSVNLLVTRTLNIEIKTESVIANVISYSIALIYNYTMSTRWSFKRSDQNWTVKDTALKFIGVNIFNLCWSSAAIWYLVGIISNMNIISNADLIQPFTKVLVTVFTIMVSFVLYKKFVFKQAY